jgi:hypothetical protein
MEVLGIAMMGVIPQQVWIEEQQLENLCGMVGFVGQNGCPHHEFIL